MSTWGKVIGAASITTGVAAAIALGGLTAQRRAVRKHHETMDGNAYGALAPDRVYSVVSADGTVVHVEEVGPERAPITLIFAHGWTLRSGSWHFQRLGLAGKGFGNGIGPEPRMVFYDQRSHGKSGRAARGGPISMDDLADDLAAVIETAAPEGPIVLIGQSMGGMSIIVLAGRNTDLFAQRVVGLGLVSTAATQMLIPGMSRTLLAPSNPVLRLATSAASRYPKVIERGRATSKDAVWLLTRTLGFARKDVPGDLVDYLDEMISGTPVDVIADFAPALMALDVGASLPALADIPTVIVCGDSDRMTPVARSRYIAEALPRAELVIIPQAGHMAIMEAPEEVNAALRRMLVRAASHAGLDSRRRARR